jgi:predicted permease
MESLVLTGLGVALAALVAWAGSRSLIAANPQQLPGLSGTGADVRVMGYASLLAIGCALVCAFVPWTQLRRFDVKRLISSSGDGRSTGRFGMLGQAMIAVQVALAVVLVTGSALTVRSFQRLNAVDTGMAIDELAQFALNLRGERYRTEDARASFWRHLVESIESIPGVRGVTWSGSPILRFTVSSGIPFLDGESRPAPSAAFTYTAGAGPGFLRVTGLALLAGRDFSSGDADRVTIVNRTFSESRGGDVVGRRLTFDDSIYYTIIGVAEDVLGGPIAEEAAGTTQLYMPTVDLNDRYERFIVRTNGAPAEMLTSVRAIVAALDPNLPFNESETGQNVVRNATARHRFLAQLLALFGMLALLLAATGVYGVVSLNVNRRARDTGIRLALGAGIRRVIAGVLATGLRPVAAGVAIGTVMAILLSRYIEGVLYELSATDPVSIALGISILLGAATLACWLPARRAGRTDPVRALRME